MHQDSYFLNAAEALKVAKEQNRFGERDNLLQLCYYDGEVMQSDCVNLVHLPIEKLLEGLAYGEYRLPKKLDFSGLRLSENVQKELLKNFHQTVEYAKIYRDDSNKQDFLKLESAKPNFQEPLRFYLMASAKTDVLQYVSQGIAETLKKMGFHVLFKLYHGIEDMNYLKDMVDFNPHVQININHLQNHYLNEHIFNIIWIQDPVALITEKTLKVKLRKRDFFFTLVKEFQESLAKKGIDSLRQSFCLNTEKYKRDTAIKREKKIVFIGSSYTEMIERFGNISELINTLSQMFQDGISFDAKRVDDVSKKFTISTFDLTSFIIPYVVRDVSVLMLCSMKSQYQVEVYGKGWEIYESVKPYYKGKLDYGEDVAKIYNSATFAFAPHTEYILQQRVFEATACGAIPILYDCREFTDEESYEEALLYFKTSQDLQDILDAKEIPQKKFMRLLEDNSYEKFIDKILTIIKKERQDG